MKMLENRHYLVSHFLKIVLRIFYTCTVFHKLIEHGKNRIKDHDVQYSKTDKTVMDNIGTLASGMHEQNRKDNTVYF